MSSRCHLAVELIVATGPRVGTPRQRQTYQSSVDMVAVFIDIPSSLLFVYRGEVVELSMKMG